MTACGDSSARHFKNQLHCEAKVIDRSACKLFCLFIVSIMISTSCCFSGHTHACVSVVLAQLMNTVAGAGMLSIVLMPVCALTCFALCSAQFEFNALLHTFASVCHAALFCCEYCVCVGD